MARWYQAVQGKAEGPYSEEEIREGLKSGRFKALDLVFREGDLSWSLLHEVPEFRDALDAPSGAAQGADCAWVVLMKKGSGYVQSGPFTAEQVMERLKTGDIEFGHHAWRAGYKRWMRIGNIPEFDRRSRDRDGDPVNQVIPLPDAGSHAPREELIQNVVRLNRSGAQPEPMAAPEEADGVDLLEVRPILMPMVPDEFTRSDSVSLPRPLPGDPSSGIVPEGSAAATSSNEAGDQAAVEALLSSKTNVTKSRHEMRKGTRLAFAGTCSFLAIVVGLYYFNHSIDQKSAAQPVPQRMIAQSPEAKPHGTPSQAPEAPSLDDPNLSTEPGGSSLESQPGVKMEHHAAEAKAGRAEKIVLEIVALKPETSPQVVFQTNAPMGEKISVTVKGLPGQILRATSYQREITLTRGAGEIPSIDLASWELAQGAYLIEASIGDVKASREVFIGRKDESFDAELKKQNEALGEQKKSERKALVGAARRYEQLTRELGVTAARYTASPAKWKVFHAAWLKQVELTQANLNKYLRANGEGEALYEREYGELQATAKILVTFAEQVGDGILQKRSIASEQVETLAAEFQRQREADEKLD